jgi:hypothetical protein
MAASPFPLRFLLQLLFGLLLVSFMVGYATWQARHLLSGPQLEITSAPPPTQSERTTTIAGTASNIVALSLNGREIYTDAAGNFTETIVLENGYTTITLAARDRYDRVETAEYGTVYTPAISSE